MNHIYYMPIKDYDENGQSYYWKLRFFNLEEGEHLEKLKSVSQRYNGRYERKGKNRDFIFSTKEDSEKFLNELL